MESHAPIDTLPIELYPLIFNDALSTTEVVESAKIFAAIRLVCKKWLASLNEVYLNDLTISSLQVSPPSSIKVSAYFLMKFHLQASSLYPIPNTLPKTAEFFKKLGNKLIYAFPGGYYIYFLETKVHTEIKMSSGFCPSSFVNIHDLGTDCVVVELESKTNKIYRFDSKTNKYLNETVNDWQTKTAEKLTLESHSRLEKVFADESGQTTHLLIKGQTQKLLLEQKEATFITISLETEIFGIKNNQIFTKTGDKITILNSNKDLKDVDIFHPQEHLKEVGISTDHSTARAELIYPFVVTELSERNNSLNSLILIFNAVNKASPIQTLDLSRKKTVWSVCGDSITFVKGDNPYFFFVYRPHLRKAKEISFEPDLSEPFFRNKIMGSPNTSFVKSTITSQAFEEAGLSSQLYLCSTVISEDAAQIKALLEQK